MAEGSNAPPTVTAPLNVAVPAALMESLFVLLVNISKAWLDVVPAIAVLAAKLPSAPFLTEPNTAVTLVMVLIKLWKPTLLLSITRG